MKRRSSRLLRDAGERLGLCPHRRTVDLPRVVFAGAGAAFAALLVAATPDLVRYVRMSRM